MTGPGMNVATGLGRHEVRVVEMPVGEVPKTLQIAPIGMMATAHVCAAIPNFLVTEWHWIDSLDLWRNWVKEGEIIQKGYIPLPERAGIGVEMNEDGARKAQVPGTPWFEPMRQG